MCVWMCCFVVGFFGGFGCLVLVLLVDQVGGWCVCYVFLLYIVVVGECYVGEDDVFFECCYCVEVGFFVCVWGYVKVVGFWVDGVQVCFVVGVFVGFDLGNVVVDGCYFLVVQVCGWNQYCEVGFVVG